MPNHCENDLTITGPKEAVAALLDAIGCGVTNPAFDFNAAIPYPPELAEMDELAREFSLFGPNAVMRDDSPEVVQEKKEWMDKKRAAYLACYGHTRDGYNSGGYEWCCANWGTKWNAYGVAWRSYDGALILTFQTTWGPPLPVIDALHRQHPLTTLHLEYFEGGGAFCGGATWASDDDWYSDDDEPWQPGVRSNVWQCRDYRGPRGG